MFEQRLWWEADMVSRVYGGKKIWFSSCYGGKQAWMSRCYGGKYI